MEQAYSLRLWERRGMEKKTRLLVEWLLKSKLGKHAALVLRHLLQEPVAGAIQAGEGHQTRSPSTWASSGPGAVLSATPDG